MKHLFTLNRYFVKYKWHFILGILFVAGSNYFGILIPQKIREALDLVNNEISLFKQSSAGDPQLKYDELNRTLMYFGLVITGFVTLKGLLMFFMRQTIIVMSRLIEYDMRKEIYAHLQNLDQKFYRQTLTGDTMARISEDVSKVRNYLGPGILYAINLVTLFIFTIIAMLRVDATLSFFALLPLPFLSISIYFVSKIINEKSTFIQQQLSTLTSITQETYSGIRVIKSYVKEDSFSTVFMEQSEEFKKRSLSLAKVEAYFQPLMMLLIALSTILVVIVGGFQVYAGKLTAGNIAEFILYVNMLTWPVTSIGWIASVVQEAEASQTRINELLDRRPSIQSENNQSYVVEGEIEFRNVSFTYPNTGIRALSNVSFRLKKGQKLAVMGKTGSGKTTIADLLTRMYDVTEGSILLDGHDIRQHNIKLLRDNIAYVPQDVFLFSDTVSANIAFGKADATKEEIEKYADYASVYEDIIRLPHGFDTMVGERGVTLSGGQKQRISIARALIKDPSIVILDDAISAVDTTTEQKIMSYLQEGLGDKTTIVISHRANNLLDYDHIIVLENGRIIQQGTHEQLIATDGFYQNVYLHQMNHQD